MNSHLGVNEESEMYFHTPSSLDKALLFYVEIYGHLYTDSTYAVERNTFNNYLLLTVCNGCLHVKTEQFEADVLPGTAVLLDCYAWHSYSSPESCEFYYVHFDGLNSRDFYEYVVNTIGNVFSINQQSHLVNFIQMLINSHSANRSVSNISSSRVLYSIITEIIATQHSQLTDEKSKLIDKALLFIADHLAERISLDDIASHVGISTYHFARMFKTATGISPHEHIILSRIDRAKYLLRTTDDSIASIAFRVGYSSETGFITSFSQRVGISPWKFRKLLHI